MTALDAQAHGTAPEGEWRARLAIAVLACLVATAVYLTVSSLAGRLASDMRYDDVSYANEAAGYLEVAVQRGLAGLAADLWHNPPHSPLEALLGIVGLAVFGLRDVSFYAINGVVLLAATVTAAAMTRRAPRATAVLAIVAVAMSPLAYLTVANFRPDMALGLATALMGWLFLDGLRTGRGRTFAWAGVAMGCALVVKPTFFAHTIALALALCGFGLLRPGAARRGDFLRFLAVGVLLAAPYFALNGRHIVEYFLVNTQGANREQWDFGGAIGWGQRLRLNGALVLASGGFFTGVALVAAAACAWHLRHRDAARAWQLASYLALAGLSAAIIVAGRHPNEMFFASFHWMAVIAALQGLAATSAGLDGPGRRRLHLAAVAALACVVVADTHRGYFGPVSEDTRIGRSATTDILAAIEADRRAHGLAGEGTPRVLVMFSGPVNHQTLIWVARLRGTPIDAWGDATMPSEAAALSMAARSDYLVFANPLSADYARSLADAKMQAPVLQRILAEKDYRFLGPVDARGRYFLVANDAPAAARRDGPVLRVDGIPLALEGLREEEGPYPALAHPLPRLRWMAQREARLCVAGLGAGARLAATVFASRAARLEVRRDAEAIGAFDLVPSAYRTIELPVDLRPAGSCIAFVAESREGGAAASDLLLFTRLELRAAR